MQHKVISTTNSDDQLILSLSSKYLRPEGPHFESLEQIYIEDVSGMSNKTVIVGLCEDSHERYVIRIFKSKASDFELESRIYRLLGEQGVGPKEIEITSVYRVEECIVGRPLTFLEMRNPTIAEGLMKILCQMNYDLSLMELVKDRNTVSSRDFLEDRDSGWFHRFKKEAKANFLNSERLSANPRGSKIQDYFN
jgi:hypothetical protein